MARIVNTHEAKTRFSELIDRALAGEEIIVARAGKPMVRLVPVEKREERPLGSGRGKFRMHDEFLGPLDEEMFDAFAGERADVRSP